MNTRLKVLAATLALSSVTAQAQLGLTGPGSVATGGFPKYYQDTTGLALDICLPRPGLERTPIRCIMADLPNPNAAISFPNNFPDEAFWWTGETTLGLDVDNGVQKEALLVLALEAAFANEVPAEGEQVAFSRIRLRINEPTPGHYKVTHPYGTEEFDVAVGDRRVFMTDDFGDFATGDFSRAGKGRLGPFLLPADAPGGNPLPPVSVTLEDGSVRQYIADAADENVVTGSPHGTNYFEIEFTDLNGVTQTFRTETFNIGGRIYNGPLDSDTTIQRASYSKDNSGYTLDVHVKAKQALGQAAPVFKVFADNMPGATLVKSPSSNSDFYGRIKVTGGKPNNIYVSDLRESPNRLFSAKVVDVVKVKRAVYDATTQTLHVAAESSDKGSNQPVLTVTGSDQSVPYGGHCDHDGNLNVNLPQPPEKVFVNSSEGGIGELAVVTEGVAAATVENLIAVNDLGVPGAIDVMSNDTTTGAVQVNIVQNSYPNNGTVFLPEFGTVTVSGNTVTYTQTKPGTGTDTFSYYLTDAAGNVSNIAKVSVNLSPINLSPVATPDFGSVSANSSVTIDVLENDSDPEGSALTISSVSSAAAAIVNNKIVYTAPAGSGGTQQTFTYTVSDADGAQATANVTVSVTQPVTVAIALAELRTSKNQWRVSGSVNPAFVGMTVKVYVDLNGNGTVEATDRLVGETLGLDAADAAAGAWDFRSTTAPAAANNARILAVSSLGGIVGRANLVVRR